MNTLSANSYGSARPLYLHNPSIQSLNIDQVNRLVIESKLQGEKRIPLHHVSRIVCLRSLEIHSNALMACLEHGVPLVVVDRHGEALGWCMGSRRKESTLKQLLQFALDDPQWCTYYEEWLSNQTLAVATQTLLMCSVPITPQARNNPRVALCNAHFVKHQQACSTHIDALGHLAHHELFARLAQESSDPTLLAWRRPGLNLIQELGGLISLHAHTDVHHATLLPDQTRLNAWSVRYYEKHATHWQQRIGHLMLNFEQFLRSHWL